MSGHSKWHNIQATKNKADAVRGKVFTKIGREIAVAVKTGGSNPDTNSKLYDIIQKAKQNNVPNDNISRSIKKAAGELGSIDYFEITYEGYGAGGVAFVVECLTDNKNRTAGDVRHAFDKCGGNLGTSGSVMFSFERKGVIVIAKGILEEDDIMMMSLEAGADDVQSEDDAFVVFTDPSLIYDVSKVFETNNIKIESSGVEYVPLNTIDCDEKVAGQIQRLTDMLEDLDDVQNVYNNANFVAEL